jgi:tRNA-2-methylthio-N6-dimethylallyladenosine synthase
MADADVIVLNTCHIREKAAEKVYSELGRVREVKTSRRRRNLETLVAVAGCVAQAEGPEIIRRAPDVDLVVGPQTYHRLPALVREARAGRRQIVETEFPEDDKFSHLPERRVERRAAAFLTVQEGCDKFCTFCVVPYTRGSEFSRPVSGIEAEAHRLVEQGAREITLLGQNVNSWGRDLAPGISTEFGELLRALDGIDGIDRIRFTSPHPKDFRDPVIAAMAECDSVCEHIHLPLQSGSSRVLKAMRRTYDRDRYLALVEKLRGAIPDLALTTDLIVGFPGETDEDFAQTIEVVREVGYDGAFTFIFSPRSGTEAATMPDHVSDTVKADRIERLIEVVQELAARRNSERVGRVEQVLVEGTSRTDPSALRGRTRRNTTVNFRGNAEPGTLVDVRIEGSTSTTLRGTQSALVAA